MTERELLEKAAKAAGLQEWGWMADTLTHVVNNQFVFWSPLTDDGDALRLAVKLNLQVTISPCYCDAYSPDHDIGVSENNADNYAATRRAIVRAAAAIGQGIAQPIVDDLPEDNYYKTQAEAEELGRAAAATGETL